MLNDLLFRLRALFQPKAVELELDEELRAHLENEINKYKAAGFSSQEATRRARLTLGGLEQIKEECRDARGTRWIEDMLQDFRYASRTLRQRPAFAVVTLLTLALGIGATTVMFTLINGVLLKPLPYPDPNRLLNLQEQTEQSNEYGNIWPFAYPNYLDCKRESRSLDMAAWRYGVGTLSQKNEAQYVSTRQISPNFFNVLGVGLFRGRAFLPEEDRPGAAQVVIVSYTLSQRLPVGSSGALGTQLVIDGKSLTVVGITPPGFRFGEEEPDVFTSLGGQDPAPNLQDRKRHPGIEVVARLQPGVTFHEAQTELALIGSRLAQQYPDSNAGRTFIAEQLRPDVGDVAATLWLLLGAVALVLLIACANVASLLLARAVSRERELAMRVALGASRSRLVRQCLTESAVLGLSGGALGILLATLAIRPFIALWPGTLPRAEEVQLDWRVLLFAVAASLLSGLLFGLAPALRAPVGELEKTLRAGARSVAGTSRRLHSSFVVSEIALAVVLLVSAGMLARTLLRLSSLDPGISLHNVLTTRVALSGNALVNPGQIRAAWQDVLDRARRIPGVQSVAAVDTVPMREGNNQLGYWTTPSVPPPTQQPLALTTAATPDYLKVMGIRLLKGRFFDEHDQLGNEPVVVIDDVLAQQAFAGQEPVGKALYVPSMGANNWSDVQKPVPIRIVGVVGHVRHWGLAGDDQAQVRAQFYYPFAQVPDAFLRRWSELMSIVVRTTIPPLNEVEPLRRELRGATGGAGGDQALYEVHTMEQLVGDSLARQRFLVLLFGIFAGLALLLACIGIYGVLAYLTGQRVPEIGVRIALGATAHEVIWLVLRHSLVMILAGVGVGLLAALGAARLLERFVEGVRSVEPLAFALMVTVLIAVGLFASWFPARRASKVDPIIALRYE
jgi:putative ABC transport system permease protein